MNCWHISDYESDAMWKLYLKGEEGIAIQSTYKQLSDSFNNYHENDVFIGVITYIDHEKDVIPWNNAYAPFVRKNKSFEKLEYDGMTLIYWIAPKIDDIYEKIDDSTYDGNVAITRFDLKMTLTKRMEIFDYHSFSKWVNFAMSNGYISYGNNYHALKKDGSGYYNKRPDDNTKYWIDQKR